MTNLIRFSPATDLRRMQREFDDLFDTFFSKRANGQPLTVWTPRVDLSETDEAYVIHMDVPGMKKEDIEISHKEGVLSIQGERHTTSKEDNKTYKRLERAYGRFSRSFTLPKTVRDQDIDATYEEGVLTINVPKAEDLKPRRIDVA